MARKFAQIQLSIWSDEDFKGLDPLTQHAFFVLISQPRVTLVGVLDYIPRRIAQCSDAWSIARVEKQIGLLEEARYVVVDEDTQELLIRSFVRNDGLLKQPNVAKGAASDYGEVMSAKLRTAIEKELKRAYREDDTALGWKAIEEVNPILHRRITGKATGL